MHYKMFGCHVLSKSIPWESITHTCLFSHTSPFLIHYSHHTWKQWVYFLYSSLCLFQYSFNMLEQTRYVEKVAKVCFIITHVITEQSTYWEIYSQHIDILCSPPGPRFNIKMTSYQYRKSHCGDKTILRLSYIHNGISYTGKMTSLYWKMTSYQYRKSHCGDKTILRPSYLHNGISYTGKMTSLYWTRALVLCGTGLASICLGEMQRLPSCGRYVQHPSSENKRRRKGWRSDLVQSACTPYCHLY